MDYPLIMFATSFALLMLAIMVSDALRKRKGGPKEDTRADAGLLLSATLTLVYLTIGFSFSMAVSRYDIRKNCEYIEAIAIGTQYSRADLLAPADAPRVKMLLHSYLQQRMLFYTVRNTSRLSTIASETRRLETDLWSAVRTGIAAVPPPLMGLLVSGATDVINSERSTQAAWLNRIPVAAWALMMTIGVGCCWVIGYRARTTDWFAFLIVPLSVSISFFLIADLDSPRGGVIHIDPQNLSNLLQTLPKP